MKKLALALVWMCFFPPILLAEDARFRCGLKSMSSTDGLKSYIGVLLDEKILSDQAFDRFLKELQNGKLINPITEAEAGLNSVLLIHRTGLSENFLERAGVKIDLENIQAWAIARKTGVILEQKSRSETEKLTASLYRPIVFHPVAAGEISIEDPEEEGKLKLTHSYEVMSTPVTQHMWVTRMKYNPSRFFHKGHTMIPADSEKIRVDGKEIHLFPNHPVDRVTWWSALVFANKLSEEKGLKPAYDLSGMSWESGTSAEKGDLTIKKRTIEKERSVSLSYEWQEVKLTAKSIYETEVYRLPTYAECRYLLQRAAEGLETENIEKYGWVRSNSVDLTHAVAELKALSVDGSLFYDLFGNVASWTQDWFKGSLTGTDPVGNGEIHDRGVCGIHFEAFAKRLDYASRDKWSGEKLNNHYGIRLVRTLK